MRTNKKVQVILFRRPSNPEFLLLLTNQGKKSFWQGVTGGVDSTDRSLKAAAIREVREELGVRLKQEDLAGPLHKFKFKTSHPDFKGQEVTEYCYGAPLPNGARIVLSHEHQQKKWLSYPKALSTIDHFDPKISLTILRFSI